MHLVELYLFVLAVRFLLFDFVLTKGIKEFLYNKIENDIFRKWLLCPYCHGFWVGVAVYLFCLPFSWSGLLIFSMNSALLSLMWSIICIPLIDKYEELMENGLDLR